MSYVEANKTWILPLLGVGAAAVIWLNVKTFNQAPAAPQNAAQNASVPEPPPGPPPPPPEAVTAPGQEETLWEDLRPLAVVPAELEARDHLEQQALTSLPTAALSSPPPPLVRRPQATEPSRAPHPARGASPGPSVPPPAADFLIDGPGGTRAWFDGQGYRTGQSLKGRPYSVQGIRILPTPKVTLQGTRSASLAQELP